MKVGVLGKISKVKNEATIDEIVDFLRALGHDTVKFSTLTEIDGVDVVIVLGGDGAILHTAVAAARCGAKIIGINYGNLGFLTEYEKNEKENIKNLLEALQANTCRIVRRSVLACEVAGKTFYALNEVALQRDCGNLSQKNPQILKLNVRTNEGETLVSGDGVLICTPTGSTAYSLSAGGAILTPEVPVFMLTPICAFSMRSRPIVFSDSETFCVSAVRGKAMLLVDGHVVATLSEGAEICVKKAPFTADFPAREQSGFLNKVKNKLNG